MNVDIVPLVTSKFKILHKNIFLHCHNTTFWFQVSVGNQHLHHGLGEKN